MNYQSWEFLIFVYLNIFKHFFLYARWCYTQSVPFPVNYSFRGDENYRLLRITVTKAKNYQLFFGSLGLLSTAGKKGMDMSRLTTNILPHCMTEEELTAKFGENGWKQLPDGKVPMDNNASERADS